MKKEDIELLVRESSKEGIVDSRKLIRGIIKLQKKEEFALNINFEHIRKTLQIRDIKRIVEDAGLEFSRSNYLYLVKVGKLDKGENLGGQINQKEYPSDNVKRYIIYKYLCVDSEEFIDEIEDEIKNSSFEEILKKILNKRTKYYQQIEKALKNVEITNKQEFLFVLKELENIVRSM